MAKMKLEPVSILVGVAIGVGGYLAYVYLWPLAQPYIPAFPSSPALQITVVP